MEDPNQPTIDCLPLPEFDETSLDAAREAFREVTAVELGQAWLQEREADFRPTTVRLGWRDEALLVLAEMDDEEIFSYATGLNQRTWELGDAFEIFLRPAQQAAYVEFHVTPNNHRLQLRFPDAEAFRAAKVTGDLGRRFLEGNVIESFAWVLPEEKRWFAFARVPAGTVCETIEGLAGQRWMYSFCRYDYSKGRELPVLSSSSKHRVADFHSQTEWGAMRFAEEALAMGV